MLTRPRCGRPRDGRPLGVLAAAIALALAGAAGLPAASARAAVPTTEGAFIRSQELRQLRDIGAPAAWRLSQGRGITVGVLDTGVGAGAPDLAGSVTMGPDFAAGINPPGYVPPYLHGTFIASLIAGHGSGPGLAGGIIGVAPAATILSVRVIPDDSEPGFALYNSSPQFSQAIAAGIRYAVRHGAGVINMSLGGGSPDRGTEAAIAYAVSRGVVVVAAAGNNGKRGVALSPYSYPASYTGVISVAALNPRGVPASFSERNSSVLLAAPGTAIVGAGTEGTYVRGSGTSPASAFVAGVAALIRSAYPRLSPALVTQALVTSARDRPAAGYSTSVGFGEVNAPAALRAAAALAHATPARTIAAAAHFGPGPLGPVQVVHRDGAQIAAYTGVAIGSGLGFLACAIVAFALVSRRNAAAQASVSIS